MIKIYDAASVGIDEILDRGSEFVSDVEDAVDEIIANVRSCGDAALFEYCEKFDRARLSMLEVSEDEKKSAMENVDSGLLDIIKSAAQNIREFHQNQKRGGFEMKKEDGVILGQRVMAMERVGVYVPGGTASYPSTVLMDVIPAKIAGVGEIIMVTPPNSEGRIADAILAAALIAGVDRIFKIGGAQAVAALAYGTESVPRVDKIVGPGNIFVATAKRKVFGAVAIDMIAGPSEILVIADKNSNPKYVAADLLSQAEHDKLATAVLITESAELANAVSAELEIQIPLLPRCDIARTSIDNNGKIIIVNDLIDGVNISNAIAPEHLEICTDEPFALLEKVTHAGSVFLGRFAPEALGDYFAGPNHTLPTSGTARFSSPLSVDDFVKKSSYTYYTDAALKKIGEKIIGFAEAEGLTAHGRSVKFRIED